MDKFSAENIKPMLGGWIAGSTCSIPLLFTGQHDLVLFLVKLAGIISAGFITGLFTLLGNDFYKYKLKNKIFKSKSKQDEQQSNEEKVA